MFILRLTPYEVAIIALAWIVLVVGIPVALRFAIRRMRRRSAQKIKDVSAPVRATARSRPALPRKARL